MKEYEIKDEIKNEINSLTNEQIELLDKEKKLTNDQKLEYLNRLIQQADNDFDKTENAKKLKIK